MIQRVYFREPERAIPVETVNESIGWIDRILTDGIYAPSSMVHEGKLRRRLRGLDDINVVDSSRDLANRFGRYADAKAYDAFARIRNASDHDMMVTIQNRSGFTPAIWISFASEEARLVLETKLNRFCSECGIHNGHGEIPVFAKNIFDLSSGLSETDLMSARKVFEHMGHLDAELNMDDISKICIYDGSQIMVEYDNPPPVPMNHDANRGCVSRKISMHLRHHYRNSRMVGSP